MHITHYALCTITQLHNYAAPLGEGGEDPVLAHDGLVEDDLGAQIKLSPQADLQHGGVVDHGGVAVVLEHLGAGLGGEPVDGGGGGSCLGGGGWPGPRITPPGRCLRT